NVRGPDVLRQLGEHGIVRGRDRLHEIDRAEVLALVVVDLPVLVAEENRDRLRLEGRERRDSFLQGGREDERLERRSRLTLALHGEIELTLVEASSAVHRDDGTVRRVDRDECGL